MGQEPSQDVAGEPKPLHPYLDPEHAPLPKSGLLRRQAWLTVLMPFLVYMFIQALVEGRLDAPEAVDPKAAATKQAGAEPDATQEEKNAAEEQAEQERKQKEEHEKAGKIPYRYYPMIYTWKIALTVAAMLLVIPGYRAFGGGVHGIGLVVGIVGGVLWIAICKLHLEPKILGPLGLGGLIDMGRRPGFNPLEQLKDDPTWAYTFLAIRFFGLVIVVPIIEEFFLRGFLMRYVMHVDWPLIPFGRVDNLALAVGTGIPMLMHPGELIAAAVWFSLVTWLMLRTKSIWDCILAHSVTNLMIGLWVITSGDWWLM